MRAAEGTFKMNMQLNYYKQALSEFIWGAWEKEKEDTTAGRLCGLEMAKCVCLIPALPSDTRS